LGTLAGQVGDAERRPRWVALSRASAKQIILSVVGSVVLLMIGIWAFQALSSFLFLILLAWLLSIAMEPIVLWLIGIGLRRGLASGVVILGLIGLGFGLGALFGQVFLAQVQQLKDAFPGAVSNGVDWVNSTFGTQFNVEQIQSNLVLTPERIADLAQQYGGGLLGVFGAVLTVLFDLVTILVFAYYLSADSVRLRQTIGSFLPPRYQPVLMTVWTIAVEKTGGYVVSKLLLAAISAVAHSVFFWAIDVPFWLPLGIIAGITAQFVPIIGTYIGVILPALFALLQRPLSVLWIIIFATIYQQIESYWLTPKISNRTMDVHPAVALGAVFVGVGLFGPIGALIGIPVAAAVITILETFRRRHELLPELVNLEDVETEDASQPGRPVLGPDDADGPEASKIPDAHRPAVAAGDTVAPRPVPD
jgi:predicted PurR-regulated permease PerM